ncbi:hypothetical protein WJX77_012135 [Trebouxia sp. C0004]
MTFTINTFATFAGSFTFSEGKQLSIEQVQDWDKLYHFAAHPAAPNLWRPLPDGSDRILPQYGLRLQGEVWYQGEEALDTGRLYADQNGVIERQTIKLCPGVAGAAARNDVAMLHSLSAEQAAAQDGFGRTACMHAALFNSWAVLKQLLLQPMLINWEHRQYEQTEHVGMTALHHLCNNPPTAATSCQHAEVIAMLPSHLPGNILNARDQKGCVPLTLALKTRNKTLVTWLLENGADPNGLGVSISPYLPIMQALQLKDVTFLQYLLTAGATVHCRNGASKSPLSLAVEKQHPEHLQLLVLYGANLESHHAQFRFGCSTTKTVRQVIYEFPIGTSGAVLKPAIAKALAIRRHLLVMILAARVAPDLPRDVVQLICQYAQVTL